VTPPCGLQLLNSSSAPHECILVMVVLDILEGGQGSSHSQLNETALPQHKKVQEGRECPSQVLEGGKRGPNERTKSTNTRRRKKKPSSAHLQCEKKAAEEERAKHKGQAQLQHEAKEQLAWLKCKKMEQTRGQRKCKQVKRQPSLCMNWQW